MTSPDEYLEHRSGVDEPLPVCKYCFEPEETCECDEFEEFIPGDWFDPEEN